TLDYKGKKIRLIGVYHVNHEQRKSPKTNQLLQLWIKKEIQNFYATSTTSKKKIYLEIQQHDQKKFNKPINEDDGGEMGYASNEAIKPEHNMKVIALEPPMKMLQKKLIKFINKHIIPTLTITEPQHNILAAQARNFDIPTDETMIAQLLRKGYLKSAMGDNQLAHTINQTLFSPQAKNHPYFWPEYSCEQAHIPITIFNTISTKSQQLRDQHMLQTFEKSDQDICLAIIGSDHLRSLENEIKNNLS
ncbi:hypothetical protein DID76_02460, partial [Candidatus Marinamargulisbacteria bacterium SCGC AG-414-C22]